MTEDNAKGKLTLSGKSTLTLKLGGVKPQNSDGKKVVQVEVRKKRIIGQPQSAAEKPHIDEETAAKLKLIAEAKEYDNKRRQEEEERNQQRQKQKEEELKKRQEKEAEEQRIVEEKAKKKAALAAEENAKKRITPSDERAESLSNRLGVKVKVRTTARGSGDIVLRFKNEKEFEKLCSILTA